MLPLLTVALPVWNGSRIAWLAMESLCRQEEIDFWWELVICEEQAGHEVCGEAARQICPRRL